MALLGVDGASAAHRHDDVGVLLPAKGDALLDIFDGRIGLDPAVDGVGNRRLVQHVGNQGGYLEFQQIRIGTDHDFFAAPRFDLAGNLLDRPFAKIRGFIQHDSIH